MPATDSVKDKRDWLFADSLFIPANWQVAALVDLLQMRGVDGHRLLRGTPLFASDFPSAGRYLSPQHFARIIANAEKLLPEKEVSFLLGQRLFPGHYGQYSALLLYAANLGQAMDVLSQFSLQLCPLWRPVVRQRTGVRELVWNDEFGLGNQSPFLAEAFIGGWLASCNWLAGRVFPWELHLRYARPAHIEQYEVHFKNVAVHFDCLETKLVVPEDWVFKPWPRASAVAFQASYTACLGQQELGARGFVGVVRQCMQEMLFQPPNLPDVAKALEISSATLKRHLGRHNTTFQYLLDEVRTVNAVHLLREKHLTNDQIAQRLRFANVNNFRRAFKRWTGFTPSEIRDEGMMTDK